MFRLCVAQAVDCRLRPSERPRFTPTDDVAYDETAWVWPFGGVVDWLAAACAGQLQPSPVFAD